MKWEYEKKVKNGLFLSLKIDEISKTFDTK